MLNSIHPKLPMRSKDQTINFYVGKLGFKVLSDYGNYVILGKGQVELHFFEFKELNPKKNYGQVYLRTDVIDTLYTSFQDAGVRIHPNGTLKTKPWGQQEFSILDPDHNLLTFGQATT